MLDDLHLGLSHPLQLGEHSSIIGHNGVGGVFIQTGSSDQLLASVETLVPD